MSRCWVVAKEADLEPWGKRGDFEFQVVGKPVRGRGSYGLKVCQSAEELRDHVTALLMESPRVLIEDFLAGEEATIKVFPPSLVDGKEAYWASLIVTRFDHKDGVAPFNSIVEVTSNSRVLTEKAFTSDVQY